MRNQFAKTIFELSKKNKNIHVVVADISPAGKMQEFQKDFLKDLSMLELLNKQ